MPNWLIPLLKWGGIALAVVYTIAVIYVKTSAPLTEGGETGAPVALYWVLLVVGVVAAIAGFVLDRRKAHGLIVDRKEVRAVSDLTDDELESELAQIRREREEKGDTTQH